MKEVRINYAWVLSLFLMVHSSCDFGDINIDPSRLDDVPVSQLLPAAQAQTARNLGSVGARISGVVIQHFEGISAQPIAYNSYILDENSLDDFWNGGLYAGAMKDCQIIMDKGEDQDIPHYTGIAKILMAINLGIATTFWGDVPYSEAFYGQDGLQPAYDTQAEIYASIQRLLDEAIAELNQDAGELTPGADDLIYGGLRAFWIGTARALKARYYMHLTRRGAEEAATNALDALKGGTISGNSFQAEFPFGDIENEANPIAYFGQVRPNQIGINPFLLNLLETKNDPRKDLYTVADKGNNVLYVEEEDQLYWGRFNSPMPLISYSELLFIRAEANLRLGNLSAAQANLDDAVRKNMEVMGIDDSVASLYLTSYTGLGALPDDEARLRRIIEEKYIAMFGQGTLEAWVDYRRTGYPVLTPAPDASESFNPSKVIPRRYLYPISERNSNKANVEAAIARQGGHLLDQPLWAFH